MVISFPTGCYTLLRVCVRGRDGFRFLTREEDIYDGRAMVRNVVLRCLVRPGSIDPHTGSRDIQEASELDLRLKIRRAEKFEIAKDGTRTERKYIGKAGGGKIKKPTAIEKLQPVEVEDVAGFRGWKRPTKELEIDDSDIIEKNRWTHGSWIEDETDLAEAIWNSTPRPPGFYYSSVQTRHSAPAQDPIAVK